MALAEIERARTSHHKLRWYDRRFKTIKYQIARYQRKAALKLTLQFLLMTKIPLEERELIARTLLQTFDEPQ
jgi:hypothetical protein